MSITPPTTRELVWADSAAQGDIAEPSDGMKGTGYTGTPAPVYQYVNWLFNRLGKWVSYLRARGIPDFDINETYSVGDRVQYQGETYVSLFAGHSHYPTELGIYFEPWGYSETSLDDYLGSKSPSPSSDIAIQPANAGTATVSSSCMFSVPGHAHGTGHKVLAIEITSMVTTGSYFDIVLTGSAAFTSAIVQVTPTNDVDPAHGVTVVTRQSSSTWRVAVQEFYNNGDHPGFNVTFTGYNNAE